MKRPAICLFIWVALLGWAAPGYAKKGGGKAAAPAAGDSAIADDSAKNTDKTTSAGGSDDKAADDTGKADAQGGAGLVCAGPTTRRQVPDGLCQRSLTTAERIGKLLLSTARCW